MRTLPSLRPTSSPHDLEERDPEKLTKKQIVSVYADAAKKISQRIPGARMPQLFRPDGTFAITGLSFTYFFLRKGCIVTKRELLLFLRAHGCCKTQMPNPRHFGLQNGLYFLVSGSYHPIKRRILKPGQYCLYSIVRAHPGFSTCTGRDRRRPLVKQEFERIKKSFDCRCAVCGSKERERNFKNATLVTKLEMGHCDPREPLSVSNCIPTCQYCNRMYKDRFVFNLRGDIIG